MTASIWNPGNVNNEQSALETKLSNALNSLYGLSLIAYDPSVHNQRAAAFFNYTFGRTDAEIASSVTPSNYAYFPGDIRRLGADVEAIDNSTALTRAILVASQLGVHGGGLFVVPAGQFDYSTTLVFKNNIKYLGVGKRQSTLMYTGNGDGVQINNPINSSTAANIYIGDIGFLSNGTNTAGKANFVDTGSTYLTIERCLFAGQRIPLMLDQTEVSSFSNNEFIFGGFSNSFGVWIINGTSRNGSAIQGFTNRLTFYCNQFNGDTQGVGFADDGGIDHILIGNNFNAGSINIRVCDALNLIVQGGEFEGTSSANIVFETTRADGGARWGFGNCSCSILGTYAQPLASQWISVAASALHSLTITNNVINSNGAAFTGINNVTVVTAQGNTQIGSGVGITGLNNYFDPVSYTPTWTASTSNPSLGNGSLVGLYSRKGNEVTLRVLLTYGSTSTEGTGTWLFSLPTAAKTGVNGIGIGGGQTAQTTFDACMPQIDAGGNNMLATATGTANAIGAGVPAAWANGNTLQMTLTYPAVNQIG